MEEIWDNPFKVFANAPLKADGELWRYMDFPKFIDLLQRKALFFTRLENLEDPLEGHHPRGYYNAMENASVTVHGPPPPPGFDKVLLNNQKHSVPIYRRYICINCWHQNKSESDAMWKLYSRDDKGIAIQSTVNRLNTCFSSPKTHEVIIGKVNYIDFRSTSVERLMPLPGLQKDLSYEHEKEIRATIWSKDVDGKTFDEMLKMKISKGHYIPVALDTLIERIYLSPFASDWHHDLINNVLKTYELNVPVMSSDYRIIPDDFLPREN